MMGISEHAEPYVKRLEEDGITAFAALESAKHLLTRGKPDQALEAINEALGKLHINNRRRREVLTSAAALLATGALDA